MLTTLSDKNLYRHKMQYEFKNPRTDFLKVNLKIFHSKFCSSPLSCPSIIKHSEASVCHLIKSSIKNTGHTRYSTTCTHPVLGIKRTLSVPQTKNMLQRSIFPAVPETAKSYVLTEECYTYYRTTT